MAANQFPVLGERNVALEDAGPHPGGRLIGFLGVFGKLKGRAAVSDRKIALFKRAVGTLLKLTHCNGGRYEWASRFRDGRRSTHRNTRTYNNYDSMRMSN